MTTRVLRAPLQLIENGYIQYEVPVENELQTYHKINLEDCGLGGCKDKVQFLQQDGCNSNTDLLKYGTFDLVLCSNLLTELYNTTNFLQSLHERVNMGGLVAFTSDYGWDEKHTPKQFVLGGFKVAGENFTSFDGLRSLLQPRFRLIQRMDVPYVLQLSKRRFEHSITDLTIWQRIR